MEEEQKKKKYPLWLVLIVRFVEVMFVLGVILICLYLFIPSSKGYVGYNVKGSITVSVNGEKVIPDNIVCYRASSDKAMQKVKIKEYDDYVYIKSKSYPYDMYYLEFDVETSDGTKHFKFSVFKAHNGGPAEIFDYELKLVMEDGEWVAYVSLEDEYGNGPEERILLKLEPDAYIGIGP